MLTIPPKTLPLTESGGITVRRTLPTRQRATIGPWCFLDQLSPQLGPPGVLSVPAHPHTHIQTVSWLWSGAIEHRDSSGAHSIIKAGDLGVMTAGRGIAHSERSISGSPTRGAQLWLLMPRSHRMSEPAFERYTPPILTFATSTAQVLIGNTWGAASPITTFSPCVALSLEIEPMGHIRIPLNEFFEHGLLLDEGDIIVNALPLDQGSIRLVPSGNDSVDVHSVHGGRLLLIGGEPLHEHFVMWWNFVAADHDEIAAAREAWENELVQYRVAEQWPEDGRFGVPAGDTDRPIHAPRMPVGRLKPRT